VIASAIVKNIELDLHSCSEWMGSLRCPNSFVAGWRPPLSKNCRVITCTIGRVHGEATRFTREWCSSFSSRAASCFNLEPTVRSGKSNTFWFSTNWVILPRPSRSLSKRPSDLRGAFGRGGLSLLTVGRIGHDRAVAGRATMNGTRSAFYFRFEFNSLPLSSSDRRER
jgi:hypothetical protein